MDLIREELLRQETALKVLLLGADQRRVNAALGGWARQGGPAETGEDGAAAQSYVQMSAAAESRTLGVFGEERRVLTADRRVWGEERLDALAGAGDPAGKVNVPGTLRTGGGGAGTQSGNTRLIMEYHAASRTPAAGAQALSRIFERDARRYDGGFASR